MYREEVLGIASSSVHHQTSQRYKTQESVCNACLMIGVSTPRLNPGLCDSSTLVRRSIAQKLEIEVQHGHEAAP